jgi:hypothetical protein
MTDTPPAGWFPDPLGRAPERFWDGSRWTDRVRDGMVEWTNPLDTATTTASTAADGQVAAGSSTAAGQVPDDPLRAGPPGPALAMHLQRRRPTIDVAAAVSVAAGVLGVTGAYALVAEVEGTAGVAVMSIVLLAGAYALALVGPPVARGAALVAGVAAPIGLIGVVLGDSLDGRAAAVVPALLVAMAWAAMFVLPGLRGAPVFIASGALAVWTALVALTAGGGQTGSGFYGPVDDDPLSAYSYDPWAALSNDIERAGALSLVLALVLAVTAAVLDRRGWHVAATPVVAVTVILGVVGLWLAAASPTSGAGDSFLVLLVGVGLAVIGALGARRGSTWIGVALATSGLIALLAEAVDDPVPAGVLLLGAAAGILAAARPVAERLTPAGD